MKRCISPAGFSTPSRTSHDHAVAERHNGVYDVIDAELRSELKARDAEVARLSQLELFLRAQLAARESQLAHAQAWHNDAAAACAALGDNNKELRAQLAKRDAALRDVDEAWWISQEKRDLWRKKHAALFATLGEGKG